MLYTFFSYLHSGLCRWRNTTNTRNGTAVHNCWCALNNASGTPQKIESIKRTPHHWMLRHIPEVLVDRNPAILLGKRAQNTTKQALGCWTAHKHTFKRTTRRQCWRKTKESTEHQERGHTNQSNDKTVESTSDNEQTGHCQVFDGLLQKPLMTSTIYNFADNSVFVRTGFNGN